MHLCIYACMYTIKNVIYIYNVNIFMHVYLHVYDIYIYERILFQYLS